MRNLLVPASMRGKMTLAALTPLFVILILVSFVVFYLIDAWILGQTQKEIRNDLHTAREVYSHEQARLADVIRFTARFGAYRDSLEKKRWGTLHRELQKIAAREGLDLLTLTDAQGRVLLRARHSNFLSDHEMAPSFAHRALIEGDFLGTVLLSEVELRRESPDLVQKAQIPLRDFSPLDPPEVERRGLFLICAASLLDERGKVIGCLYGGILLNNNLDFVDRIREVVYGREGTEGGSATIFLKDRRVATTIRLEEKRALGTQVSSEVSEAVLQRKEPWLGLALVVNEWYLTAYEPIFGDDGQAIGALYVGVPEAPYVALKQRAVLVLCGLLLLGCGLGYLMARFISSKVAAPLQQLDRAAQRISDGEWESSLHVAARDEIGRLTATFNRMAASLRERELELSGLNRVLEQKVEERTEQLESKSLQLIQAQDELLQSEKLAAIGSLAAGVAHEINNPAAIVRGNVEILLMELPPDAPGREEVLEIMKQTERISSITRNLLAFAREQATCREKVFLNELLEDVLSGVGHQVPLENVELCCSLQEDLPAVVADGERLRQVFNNIVINALQAMQGDGTLRVETRCEDKRAVVDIRDSGPGVDEEIREKIFNPFFTTRNMGTGLGLSVSYGIVKALKGKIEVENAPEGGAHFKVIIPVDTYLG